MHRQGQGAYPYARIFAILQISHELLCLGVTASQRDVFYRQVAVPTMPHLCGCICPDALNAMFKTGPHFISRLHTWIFDGCCYAAQAPTGYLEAPCRLQGH